MKKGRTTNKNNILIKHLIIAVIVLLLNGCQNHISPTEEESKEEILYPPDKSLSVAEILKKQKINILHFYQWDSIWVEDHLSSYSLTWEVFLDSKHIRIVEYSHEQIPSLITVIDIEKWNVWQYSKDTINILSLLIPILWLPLKM